MSRRKRGPERTEQWQEILGRWRESGMSQAAFCRQEKLNVNTFTWWKIAILGRESSGSKAKKRAVSFLPIVTDAAGEPGDIVHLPPGKKLAVAVNQSEKIVAEICNRDGTRQVRIFDGASPDTVAAIVGACFKS